jgi:hypothetical protein
MSKTKQKGEIMNKITIKKTITEYEKLGKNYTIYNDNFIRIRNSVGGSLLICFHCEERPAIGSMIGILFTNKGNKIVCSDCQELLCKEIPTYDRNKKED